MDKINWINGQAGGTPLSAENLNLMQDNVEDAIDEVDNDLSNLNTYSTTEKRIGTWIDGKPLYRKVVSKTTTSKDTTLNISDIPFDYIKMDARVILNPGLGNEYRIEPFYQSNSDFVRAPFVSKSDKAIALRSSQESNVTRIWVIILEYTKTTD